MTERRRRVIGVTASLLLLVGGLGAHACQTTLEAWAQRHGAGRHPGLR